MVCSSLFLAHFNCTLTRLSHPQGSNIILPRSALARSATYRPFTHVGSISSYPSATEKHTETGKNSRFAYGLSEMQGWRLSRFYGYQPLHSLPRSQPTHCFFLSGKDRPPKSTVFFMIPDIVLARRYGRFACSFIKPRRTPRRCKL